MGEMNFVKQSLLELFQHQDTTPLGSKMKESMMAGGMSGLAGGQSVRISKEDFAYLLQNQTACVALMNVGVDVVGLVDFIDVLFQEEQDMDFAQFMITVLQLRGSNKSTVKDLVDLRKHLTSCMQRIENRIEALERPGSSGGAHRAGSMWDGNSMHGS